MAGSIHHPQRCLCYHLRLMAALWPSHAPLHQAPLEQLAHRRPHINRQVAQAQVAAQQGLTAGGHLGHCAGGWMSGLGEEAYG